MQFLESYVGAAAVFLLGMLAVIFANGYGSAPHTATTTPTTASSTVAIATLPTPQVSVPDLSIPSTTTELATSAPTHVKTLEPIQTVKPRTEPVPTPAPTPAPATPVSTTPAPAPATQPTPATEASSGTPLDASSSALRGALVNILCYAPAGGVLHSISGSGVFIDSKGIILTNAHIGQYFLLADKGVTCSIRTGSPAVDTYKAALIFISPLWVRANPTVLTQASPIGTGQYDIALLAVTGSETHAALPSSFPSISLTTQSPAQGTQVVIATYGAQFLSPTEIQSSLYPTIVFGAVKDIFTFSQTTVDAISLGGSAAAQEGSSGGGVADASGQLVGMITTSTIEGNTSSRTLGAITASYVRAEYATEMGSPIELLLNEPTDVAVAEFAPEMLLLEPILTAQLQ